jgi:excisionase family DNA binding protein
MGELLNKEQASAYVGVSVRTLQRLAERGDIPRSEVTGKKGKEARFDEDDLRAYLERNRPMALMRAGAVTPDVTPDTALVRQQQMSDLALMIGEALKSSHPAAPVVMLSDKLLLSLPEASTLSGVPLARLRLDAHNGKLKMRRVGRGLGKVHADDLAAYAKKL